MGLRQHAVFLKVAPVLLVLVSATFSIVSVLNVDVRWGRMQSQVRLRGVPGGEPGDPLTPFSDEDEDSIGLRSIAFRMVSAVQDVQGLRLRYAHSYAQLEEESMLDVFLCRDGNGGEDGTCAGVKSFVREVQAVARRSLALIITAVVFSLLSFFMVVGSRLVRENKYTIHASWMLVLFAEVFYVAALALWGVRVLNARIDTNGAEISAGVGFGLASIAAIFNFAALVVQLVYLRLKPELELSSSEAALHDHSSPSRNIQSTRGGAGAASSSATSSATKPPPFEGDWSGAAAEKKANGGGVIDREESYSATNPFDGEQQVPPYDGERSVSAAAGGGMMPPPPSTTIVRESQANPFDSAGHSGGGGSGAYGDDKDDLGW